MMTYGPKYASVLTFFFPMFHFDPPENIRKSKVFWCFQRDQKRTLGRKGLSNSNIERVGVFKTQSNISFVDVQLDSNYASVFFKKSNRNAFHPFFNYRKG